MGLTFLLRWSVRDLRRRWLQVAAIALVIGVGTGVYAGLGSTATWRRVSNDASFEQLAMYDLRVRTAEGASAGAGAMLAALDALPDPGIVAVAEERLVLPTQVDASTAGETILVPGRIIGVDTRAGGPHVNGIHVPEGEGRGLSAADAGQPVAVLERNFASFYDLPAGGELLVAGGKRLRYVGQGLAPEYFFVMTEEGGFFAEANFAVVFVSLETAQSLGDRPGRVNDLVLRLRPGVDPAGARAAVEQAFSGSGLGVTVMRTEDEDAYRILYDDIEGDQRFWNVFAALVLAGAAFGAFNLAVRMVEAQRREIGIGMALGAPPPRLALRPLLVGAEIAVLGTVFGVGMGLLVDAAIRPVFVEMLPLPVWITDFQPAMFLRGAALSFAIPLLATAWPVWRAVRVMPVEAIATTHRSARGGLAPLLRRLGRPLSAFRRMPVGNVLRTPRRSVLTALGIGAAITTLVSILGLLDSFRGTMDSYDRELLQDRSERVLVSLDRFVAAGGPEVAAVTAAPAVGRAEAVTRLGATLSSPGGDGFGVALEAVDMDSDVWSPTLLRAVPEARRSGLVIARKAAADLGVEPGDTVTLEAPVRRGEGFSVVRLAMPVAGIHPNPFRFNAYLDRSLLPTFGLGGLANALHVVPAAGFGADDVQRALFGLDGVASALPAAAAGQIVRDSLDGFTGVFRAIQFFILLLAVLIAYNATSINTDERARERATLFAFGLPLRRIVGFETAEGLIVGGAGTVVGAVLGLAVVRWMATSIVATTMPDLGFEVVMTGGTIATAVVMGVVAVAIAPLFMIRRLRRMDIPGTLRVVE